MRLNNIREIFYAQKAVLFPLMPLYNINRSLSSASVLKPQLKVALERVFRLFDMDRTAI